MARFLGCQFIISTHSLFMLGTLNAKIYDLAIEDFCRNDDIGDVMGFPDNLKQCSCMTLFEVAASEIKVFGEVLDKFYDGHRDMRTLEMVQMNKN